MLDFYSQREFYLTDQLNYEIEIVLIYNIYREYCLIISKTFGDHL